MASGEEGSGFRVQGMHHSISAAFPGESPQGESSGVGWVATHLLS